VPHPLRLLLPQRVGVNPLTPRPAPRAAPTPVPLPAPPGTPIPQLRRCWCTTLSTARCIPRSSPQTFPQLLRPCSPIQRRFPPPCAKTYRQPAFNCCPTIPEGRRRPPLQHPRPPPRPPCMPRPPPKPHPPPTPAALPADSHCPPTLAPAVPTKSPRRKCCPP